MFSFLRFHDHFVFLNEPDSGKLRRRKKSEKNKNNLAATVETVISVACVPRCTEKKKSRKRAEQQLALVKTKTEITRTKRLRKRELSYILVVFVKTKLQVRAKKKNTPQKTWTTRKDIATLVKKKPKGISKFVT